MAERAEAPHAAPPAAPAEPAAGTVTPGGEPSGNPTEKQAKKPVDKAADSAQDSQQSATEALEAAIEALGPFGLYQRYSLALLLLPSLLSAMYSLNYIFTAGEVPFRCMVPECEGAGAEYNNATLWALLPADACRRHAPRDFADAVPADACDAAYYDPDTTQSCDAFLYESQETIYAEFDLACREWRRTLVGTVRNAALPLALVLTGYVSDSWGRLTALCVLSACAGALGLVKGFSVNYPMYLALEFLEAALGYGFNSAAYVMMVELARPGLRAAFAAASGVAYGLGGVLLAALAARTRYWRHLLWAAHTPALLLPLYWLLLDESWRWLHASRGLGHRARAAALLRKAARWNKVVLDEALLARVEAPDVGKVRASRAAPWLGALRSRALLARLAAVGWCWVAAAFVYYGLTINSVSLAGDKYINFALNMCMEVVASLLLVMALERFGRRWSICGAFLLCGSACVAPFYTESSDAALALYFVGKLAITFAFNSLYVFSAELFPTDVRSSALAACSLIGRIGSILAPQTPLLSVDLQATLYGGCSALAAAAVALVPETRRAPLPHDTAAAERLRVAPPEPPAPAPPAPRVLSADDA